KLGLPTGCTAVQCRKNDAVDDAAKRQWLSDCISEYWPDSGIPHAQPMHFHPFGQLPNHWNWSTAFASLGSRDATIPNRAGNVHLSVTVVLPEQALDFSVPQAHECCHGECCGGGLGEHGEDALDFLQRVRICFLRLRGSRIDGCVAGRVLALEVILLLRQREYRAYNT